MANITAVEWLKGRILNADGLDNLLGNIDHWIEQAEQIEKENIIEAWDKRCTEGTFISGWHIETKSGEQYYNEQFKNK